MILPSRHAPSFYIAPCRAGTSLPFRLATAVPERLVGWRRPGLLLPRYLLARKKRTCCASPSFTRTDLHAHILPPTESYEGCGQTSVGFARIARQLRRWKTRYPPPPSFLMAEISIREHLWVTPPRGEIMIRCLKPPRLRWLGGRQSRVRLGHRSLPAGRQRIFHAGDGRANVRIDGHEPQPEGDPKTTVFSNLRPCMVKEVAGVRVGVVGLIYHGDAAMVFRPNSPVDSTLPRSSRAHPKRPSVAA